MVDAPSVKAEAISDVPDSTDATEVLTGDGVAGAVPALSGETDAGATDAPADDMADIASAADPVLVAADEMAERTPATDDVILGDAPDSAPQAEVVASPDGSEAATVPGAAADEPLDDDAGAAPSQDAASGPVAAYAVDDSVLAILREEAEREVQARRAEAKPLEVQQDLGVETVLPARKPVETVPASPEHADEDADPSAKPSARRDLLPDVEEINSTLRPSEQPADAGPMAGASDGPVEGRSSFRSGFLVVMTVAILGAALYIAAPMLRDAVPGLAGFLDAYVGFVDGLRLRLDGLMQSATTAMGGEAG
jgi:hypothetical protein